MEISRTPKSTVLGKPLKAVISLCFQVAKRCQNCLRLQRNSNVSSLPAGCVNRLSLAHMFSMRAIMCHDGKLCLQNITLPPSGQNLPGAGWPSLLWHQVRAQPHPDKSGQVFNSARCHLPALGLGHWAQRTWKICSHEWLFVCSNTQAM